MCARCGKRAVAKTKTNVERYGIDGICHCQEG